MKKTKRFAFCAGILFFAILAGILTGCAQKQKEIEFSNEGWWGTVASNEVTEDGSRTIRILLSDTDTDGKCFILTPDTPDTYVGSYIPVEQILPGDYIHMHVIRGIQTEEGIVCIELIIEPPHA